jgi:hypothetical protein
MTVQHFPLSAEKRLLTSRKIRNIGIQTPLCGDVLRDLGPGPEGVPFDVKGQEFKDFDVAKIAKGVQRAYIEEVDVDIADGKLDIKFTPDVQNPMINGIEILPAKEAEKSE